MFVYLNCIIVAKEEADNVNLTLDLMNVFNCIRFDEITKEDFNNLSSKIDSSSMVYDSFQKAFNSFYNDGEPYRFKKMIKSLGFPTSRGVEQTLLKFEEPDSLTMILTMPLSGTSPEWNKIIDNIVEGWVQKCSVVHENSEF